MWVCVYAMITVTLSLSRESLWVLSALSLLLSKQEGLNYIYIGWCSVYVYIHMGVELDKKNSHSMSPFHLHSRSLSYLGSYHHLSIPTLPLTKHSLSKVNVFV